MSKMVVIISEGAQANCKVIYGCAQYTESKLLLDVLTQQRLTNYFEQTKVSSWESYN